LFIVGVLAGESNHAVAASGPSRHRYSLAGRAVLCRAVAAASLHCGVVCRDA
jgi:hypothetical protein